MNALNDSLDGLFGGPQAAELPAPAPRSIVLDERMQRAAEVGGFFERCRKCNGSGQVRWGQCFACQGKGGKKFKTSAADRAKARDKSAERKVRNAEESWAFFQAEQPEVAAWIIASQDRFPFAASMKEAICKFGSLTANQLAACQRSVAKVNAAKAERQDRVANAKAVDVSKIEGAFALAREKAWAKNPGALGVRVKPLLLQAGEVAVQVTPGSDGSQWEGMLFVKTRDGKKLGSVKAGKFTRRFECTPAEEAAVLDACSDPAKAAVAFGKAWSICSVCGRGLENAESIERGIGPVCAEKFGW